MIKLFSKYLHVFAFICFTMLSLLSMECNIRKTGAMPALPLDAVSNILAAFDNHSIVALGEGDHNNEQGHAFRLSLIRDPRFSTIVNDIVVEFGNGRYQDIMDRFISGEEVAPAVLRQVWQNTTQRHPIWDVPIYEEFFRAVRTVNASLPKDRKMRILLGDPPINWDSSDAGVLDKFLGSRDSHPAEVIQKEVIAKKRRALVIYGDNHFLRNKPIRYIGIKDETLTEVDDTPSLVSMLEKTNNVRIFTIKTYTSGSEIEGLQHDIASWLRPSLVKLRGTILGTQDYGFYYPGVIMIKLINDKPQSFKVRPGIKMQDQFDALLYLGPISTITYSELSVGLCKDLAYIEMRKSRMTFDGKSLWAENFQKFCDAKMAK